MNSISYLDIRICNIAIFIRSPKISWTVTVRFSVTVTIGNGFQFLIKISPEKEKKLYFLKIWFCIVFFLPSILSSCSILPTSASMLRKTTLTISWNFVCAGMITKPSCNTRCGHSSRATTQCTGKNLLFNARPRK